MKTCYIIRKVYSVFSLNVNLGLTLSLNMKLGSLLLSEGVNAKQSYLLLYSIAHKTLTLLLPSST